MSEPTIYIIQKIQVYAYYVQRAIKVYISKSVWTNNVDTNNVDTNNVDSTVCSARAQI